MVARMLNDPWTTKAGATACLRCTRTFRPPGPPLPDDGRPRHHANGLCTTCYRITMYGVARRGWPTWLGACLRCLVPAGSVWYRGHGLCGKCKRHARSAHEMPAWRAKFAARRAGYMTPAGEATAMVLQICRCIGSEGGAKQLGVEVGMFRCWAGGEDDVPLAWWRAIEDLHGRVLELEEGW